MALIPIWLPKPLTKAFLMEGLGELEGVWCDGKVGTEGRVATALGNGCV